MLLIKFVHFGDFLVCAGFTVLEFLNLNSTGGVVTQSVGHFDDGVSHAINIPQGIPFGSLHHTFIFVSEQIFIYTTGL